MSKPGRLGYGSVSDDARAALATLGAVHFSNFAGFER